MRILITLIALAATATGCVTAPDPTGAGADPASPGMSERLPWGLTDCEFLIGIAAVPAERLAPHLPEGFRALTPEEAGLPPALAALGDATFAVEAFECASAIGANGTVEQAAYGSLFAFVEPPAELVDEEVDFANFVKWDTLIAEDGLRDALVAWGAPARVGNVTTGDLPVALPGPVAQRLLAFEDGTESYGLNANTPNVVDAFSGKFAEYTPVDGGVVKWFAPFETTSVMEGTGYLKVNGDGLGREILQDDRTPALFIRVHGSFIEGAYVEFIRT